MIVIKGVTVDSNNLTSSIAEPDAAQGEVNWTAGTYTTGTRRVEGVTIYEVTADPSTSDQPSVGAKKNPASWVAVAPINKYAMFDGKNTTSTKLSGAGSIVVNITPNEVTNGLAVFGIKNATAINVTMTDPVNGQVYNKDIDMVDNSMISTEWDYCFLPIIRIERFILLDLPPYINASTEITITGTDLEIANVAIGRQIGLGEAEHGTGYRLIDTSRQSENLDGEAITIAGDVSFEVDFNVKIERTQTQAVTNILQSMRGIPSAWVATEREDVSSDPISVFGTLSDVDITYTDPAISDASFKIRGFA